MRKRIFVVGSWAKEHITAENLKRSPDTDVFVFMDTRNPAIMKLADGHRVGDLYDVESIADYARSEDINLVLITTAAPLSAGLVDRLHADGIRAFGPTQLAARLESDKAFARSLMKKHGVSAIPEFKVFDDPEDAVDYARSMNWEVAVKPVGLTEGLGVRVFGDQLESDREVVDYITRIARERLGGSNKVIVEQKLEGEEFTLQCLVNDEVIVPTPAVQDFKKLLPGEKGPNTASMGSYSDTGFLLPFMKQQHYDSALTVIAKTMDAFKRETGEVCRGFLYGQFMLTRDGIKLIEFNFRPGDPEWMNTLFVLDEDISAIIYEVMEGRTPVPSFEEKATVCKYIVPPEYPAKLNQVLQVSFDRNEIEELGVGIYYSGGLDEEGRLNVGSERGIAFIAKADSITEANMLVEEAISKVKGDFYHRSDIGTKELLETKVARVRELTDANPVLRNPREDEFLAIYDFVSKCPPLEYYYEHVYRIILRYFRDICFVAESDGKIVGWLLGIISQPDGNKYLVWQVGVDSSMRGKALGKRLLNAAESVASERGCTVVEATVDPDNVASRKLFEACGYENVSSEEGEVVVVQGNEAVKDFYSPGRHFMVYQKQV